MYLDNKQNYNTILVISVLETSKLPVIEAPLTNTVQQGWRCGESARLHTWVEFVGSRLVPKVFLRGTSVFLPQQKSATPNSQFDQDRGPVWKPAKSGVASSLNIVI